MDCKDDWKLVLAKSPATIFLFYLDMIGTSRPSMVASPRLHLTSDTENHPPHSNNSYVNIRLHLSNLERVSQVDLLRELGCMTEPVNSASRSFLS